MKIMGYKMKMMEAKTQNELVRTAAGFFIIACVLVLIYVASDILFPLIMALLFGIILRPISKFLNEKLKIPNFIAIGFAVLLGMSIIFSIFLFMSDQIANFMNDLPTIKQNLYQNVWKLQNWISKTFGFSFSEQEDYVGTTLSNSDMFSSSSIGSITNTVLYFVLIPVYTFLILSYRSLLLGFLLKLVPQREIENLKGIITEVKSVIRSYIIGLLMEVVVVATLTSFGLWLVGVEYFIFLGVMTAFLNLIPYIGIIVACTISAFIALVGSNDPSVIIGVLIVNAVVQFIDNNILIPKIVGSKVSINALASMVGVIVGGSLAGISGMFLAIPMIAILKVVFDHVPNLKPFGYLMGDDIPKSFDWNKIRLPIFTGDKEASKKPEDK